MSSYETNKSDQNTDPVWRIQDVHNFFINDLGAVSIPLDHPDLKYYLTDPYIPERIRYVEVYDYKYSILSLRGGEYK